MTSKDRPVAMATSKGAEPSYHADNMEPSQAQLSYLPLSSQDRHQRSSGLPSTKQNTEDEDADEQEDGETFWETIFIWYLPLIFLWLRRSMFGTANLLRTILVGQCLRLILAHCGELPKWVQPWFSDPHAWPPPAFSVLAVLTLVAFVVHPEGLTWFMIGKLRDAILSLLQSFATCWTMFIQDYGIITTTIALMTLAGIGCLLAILLKHSMPKTKRRPVTPENKSYYYKGKKKKKGTRGKGGRLRQHARAKPVPENQAVPTLIEDDDDSSHQNTEDASIASTAPSPAAVALESHVEDSTSGDVQGEMPIDNQQPLYDTTIDSTTTTLPTTTRTRMQSVSTVDTDEFSCNSTSVLSFSSTPATADTSVSSKPKSKKSRKSKRKKAEAEAKAQQEKSQAASPRQQTDGRPIKPLIAATTGRFANLKDKDTRFDRQEGKMTPGSVGAAGPKTRSTSGRNQPSTANSLLLPSERPPVTPSRDSKFAGSSIQYGSPNSPPDEGTQKQELASFVSRAGLNDATSLVQNISDVDSLERLSDIQLQLYGVGADEQAHLHRLLHERRHIRPPPGLTSAVYDSSVHDEPPTLFSSPNRGVVGQSVVQAPQSHPFAYDVEEERMDADHSESRIEAELQELGGQMVGSVLDF